MRNYIPSDFLADMTAEGKALDVLNSFIEGRNSRGTFNGRTSYFLKSLDLDPRDINLAVETLRDHGRVSFKHAFADMSVCVFKDDKEVCLIDLDRNTTERMSLTEFEAELSAEKRLIAEAKRRAAA